MMVELTRSEQLQESRDHLWSIYNQFKCLQVEIDTHPDNPTFSREERGLNFDLLIVFLER